MRLCNRSFPLDANNLLREANSYSELTEQIGSVVDSLHDAGGQLEQNEVLQTAVLGCGVVGDGVAPLQLGDGVPGVISAAPCAVVQAHSLCSVQMPDLVGVELFDLEAVHCGTLGQPAVVHG